MPELLVPDYIASERQTKFHLSDADETLYGGAAGGGKSAALAAHAVTMALRYPGIRIYMFRNTIPELKATLIPEIQKQCAAYMQYGHMTYHGQDRQFRLRNGSIIQMAYMENPGDQYKYQGAEIQILMFDELTHFTQDQYEYLKTRVRDSSGKFPLKIYGCTNPGNIGHGWVKAYFIDVGLPEQIYTDRETGKSRVFIPAKVSDHPIESFRTQYASTLNAISDESLRRALLEGDWDQFSGQVFTEWRREKHVHEPFQIPDHWLRWMAYDHGYNTYAAAVWFAKNPNDQHIYLYRELYESQMAVSKLAEKIKELDRGEDIRYRLADPAIWKSPANAETGENIAQIMDREGVHFQPANNDRLAGKNAVHEALALMPDGIPQLRVFANCINVIRTLPTLPYDDHKVEDVDTDAEDHLYDTMRYGLVGQREAKIKKEKRRKNYDPVTGRLLS